MTTSAIIAAFQKKDPIEASLLLPSLALKEMSLVDSVRLLVILTNACFQRNLRELLVETVKHFTTTRQDYDPSPSLFYLLAYPLKLPRAYFQFLLASFPDFSPIEYLVEIVHCESVPDANRAFRRLCQEMPAIPLDTWMLIDEQVTKMTDEETTYHNPLLAEAIKKKILSADKIPPSWVRSYPEKSLEKCPIILSGEEAVEKILASSLAFADFTSADQVEEEAMIKEGIFCTYSLATVAEKMQMIFSAEIFDDQDHFREYGPLNSTRDNTDCDRNGSGGCRMFTCTCGEPIEEDDCSTVTLPSLRDWFVGYCKNGKCGNPIRSYCWALRLPLVQGSWQGCYCSFPCLQYRASKLNNPLLDNNLRTLSTQLSEIGIRSR